MGVSVTEFETAAFEGFEKEWFSFSVVTLLFVKYSHVVLRYKCPRVVVTEDSVTRLHCRCKQRFSFIKSTLGSV